jgi:hypothetical protein
MDRWAWGQLDAWLEIRRELPIGAVICVIHGPTAGRRWEASDARKQLHQPQWPSVGGSLLVSCGTRTRSRWRMRGSRSS